MNNTINRLFLTYLEFLRAVGAAIPFARRLGSNLYCTGRSCVLALRAFNTRGTEKRSPNDEKRNQTREGLHSARSDRQPRSLSFVVVGVGIVFAAVALFLNSSEASSGALYSRTGAFTLHLQMDIQHTRCSVPDNAPILPPINTERQVLPRGVIPQRASLCRGFVLYPLPCN